MFCGDKLPESTGDKLTARGDGFQLSWGTGLDSPGEVLNCGGSDSFECLIYCRGTILNQDCRGCLFKDIYAAGEMLRSTGGYPTSLRFDNFAWRRVH